MTAKRLFTLADQNHGQLGDDVLGGLGTGYTEGSQQLSSFVVGQVGYVGTGVGSHTLASSVTGVEGNNGAAAGSNTITSEATGTITVTGFGTGNHLVAGSVTGEIAVTGTATHNTNQFGAVAGSVNVTGTATGRHTTTSTATGTPDTPTPPAPPVPFTRSGGWRRYVPQQPQPPDVPTIRFGSARHTSQVTHRAAGFIGRAGTTSQSHIVNVGVVGERWPTDQLLARWRDDADLLLLEVFE